MLNLDLSPVWISLKTASVATAIAFFLGIAAARWMFSYQGKGKGLIDGIFTLPLVLPPTVVGFLLLLLLGKNSPIGHLLNQLGITIIFSWSATVIAATVVAFPLMYKTVLGAFEQVETNLIHCARTLGASEWRIFWQVILPLGLPGVVAGTILAFARALGEFGATLMLAGSIPGKTQTIAIAIFFASESGNMTEALFWVLLMIGIALGAISAINYWSGTQQFFNKRVITRCLLFISQFSVLINRFSLIRTHKQRTTNNQQPTTNNQLFLNLKKHLPSFTLETTFTTNGKPLGLLGASGSGKSMTLRCIAGLETPTEGRIVLNGRVLFDSKRGINIPTPQRRIGFVFQNYALFPHMSVMQNIAFGLQHLPKVEQREQILKYMNIMQLKGLEHRYPHQLSGGQQQRVALARALAIAPDALLLDEPLSALDTYLRSQIEKLLTEVFSTYEGVTLFVTHKLEEAYRICDNLLVMSEGKAIAYGSKADIFERPRTYTVAQITECKNFSRTTIIDSQHINALDWNCTLQVIEPIPNPLIYVGIRAHHFSFPKQLDRENTFPCWLVQMSETQHRMTLYLKLHSAPTNPQEYHLQVEIFKEKWVELKDRSFPWFVHLDPLRLMLMEG